MASAQREWEKICKVGKKKSPSAFSIKFRIFRNQVGMNKVLFTYLLRELTVYFLIAFIFFFMIFFVNQILLMAESILRKRVPIIDVVKLITYSLPFIVAQSAPFATLVGFLMCLGRMATDNEVLVLRALGMSYVVFLVPVLVLGLVISLISFGVNDYLLPRGSLAYNRLYTEILISNPAIELEPYSVKRAQNSVLVIGDVQDNKVSDLIYFDEDNTGTVRIIVAGETDILQGQNSSVLMQLGMDTAQMLMLPMDTPGDYDYIVSDKTRMNVFASEFLLNSVTELSPRDMTSFDLSRKIKDMRRNEEIDPFQLNIYELEFHKKFALPFGSIFFALLAMPLSIMFGKHNGQTIGLIIGIFICVVYWAMLIIGQTFGFRSGANGMITMWGPNILIGIAGILFYLKLRKD